MEPTTTFDNYYNIYWENTQLNTKDLNNRLLCTFVSEDTLDDMIYSIENAYSIMYNKMFVLFIKSTGEYAITYNVDQGNVSNIPKNTILVHRKKEFNVLYSLNGLNEIIKTLNGGVVDPSFKINWQHYQNSILLTQEGQLKQLNTKIHKIVEL
jgi:hypothetical protein